MFLELNQLIFLHLQKLCWSILLFVIISETMILELRNALLAAAAFIERYRVRVSLLLIVVSRNFIWALLCVAKPSTASMNDSTKSRGLELKRNIGMAIRFEDIETDIGTCLPIQVVVCVFEFFFRYTDRFKVENS